MPKKVVIEVADFETIVAFVVKQSISFARLDEAVKVKQAITRAQVMNADVIEKNEDKHNNSHE